MKKLYRNLIMAVAVGSMAACSAPYTPVETFAEADDPVALTAEQSAAWEGVTKALNGGWGCLDLRYSRSEVPTTLDVDTYRVTAWRGERASAQILLWTAEGADGVECEVAPFKGDGATLPASIAETRFVRYTIADEQNYNFKKGGPTVLMPGSSGAGDIEMAVRLCAAYGDHDRYPEVTVRLSGSRGSSDTTVVADDKSEFAKYML